MVETLITRTGSCPGLLGTDVAVSPRLLFLPPIKSSSLIGVSEVYRHSCVTECFRFPHVVVCRCTAAFHICYSYRKDSKAQSRIVVRWNGNNGNQWSLTPFTGSWSAMVFHVVRRHPMKFNSWWLTCSYSFHFWHEGSQTALNRVFYFENLSSEAVQIAHISEDWVICAAQKVISWGEIQYPGSPCMRQTEKKSVQRECHRNPKQHIPQVRKRLQLLHWPTDLTHAFLKSVLCVSARSILKKKNAGCWSTISEFIWQSVY